MEVGAPPPARMTIGKVLSHSILPMNGEIPPKPLGELRWDFSHPITKQNQDSFA